MKVISLLILIIVFVSCGNKKAIDSDLVETTKDSTLKESDEADYLEQETDIIDQSLEQNIMIVQDKIYHEDEISGESEQREWVGLFKNADRYYLEEVRLNFERVKDELLDEKDQKTGWKISTENKDESIFFVSGLSNVIEGDVRFNQLDKNETLPEESCSFSFLNKDYKLYATGQKRKVDEDYYEIENYKLFLTTEIDGEKITQLLVEHLNFADQMVSILFLGDIDRDGILDLLINDTRHYNVTNPTLFLSGKASKGEIVKKVAFHNSVGC